MYAIIESGSKQYKVEEGSCIDIEKLDTSDKAVSFKNVLYVQTKDSQLIGKQLKNVVVKGEIIGDVKGPKVVSFKYKRRKSQKLKQGHRQKYTRVKITQIQEKGEKSGT